MSLLVQVLGKGLIPRGYGIAPKKEPFPADIRLISDFLNKSNLIVNMIHPDDGHVVRITRNNLKKLYEAYGKRDYSKPVNRVVAKPETLIDRNVKEAENPKVIPSLDAFGLTKNKVVNTVKATSTPLVSDADITKAVDAAINEMKKEPVKTPDPITTTPAPSATPVVNTTKSSIPTPTTVTTSNAEVKSDAPKTDIKPMDDKKDDVKKDNNPTTTKTDVKPSTDVKDTNDKSDKKDNNRKLHVVSND